MDVRQNLQLYKDMIQCAGPLYLWAYNDCGRLVYSNCPDEEVLAQVFELFGCKKRLYDHLLPDTPMQVSSSIGLQWCAAAETDGGKVKMVYLIGPYFTENTVLRNMELAMRQLQNLNLSVETTMQIEKALKALPTLATNIMNHYAITLNYCVTGVQKNTFDIIVFPLLVIFQFPAVPPFNLHIIAVKKDGKPNVVGIARILLRQIGKQRPIRRRFLHVRIKESVVKRTIMRVVVIRCIRHPAVGTGNVQVLFVRHFEYRRNLAVKARFCLVTNMRVTLYRIRTMPCISHGCL